MQPMPNAPEASEAPLYVRWGPNGSPYAIELKLDLVAKIRNILLPVAGNAEVGGVLVGSLPSSYSPTLRVEDVEPIRRDDKDGVTFMIDPRQENRVEEVRRGAREIGRSVVGLFRSHRRPGALRPSLADRGLLSTLFTEPVSVLLLVEGNEPHSAAFFLAQDRQLPAEPSVREFKFDEREFKLLPEVEPESSRPRRAEPETRKPKTHFSPLWIAGGGLLLISLLYFSSQGSEMGKAIPLLRSNELDLIAAREGPGLRVSWNNSSGAFNHASGARLVVRRSGSPDQEVQLGLDDLRLGAVEVENSAVQVDVTLVVEVPGSTPVTQSVRWERP
ncbi:MAG: hypothetical protein ACJ746_09000 [Bryobacteraceae bacterium]